MKNLSYPNMVLNLLIIAYAKGY